MDARKGPTLFSVGSLGHALERFLGAIQLPSGLTSHRSVRLTHSPARTHIQSIYPIMCKVLLFSLVLGSSSCHHATEPPPPPGIDTTSHNVIWTMTTLGNGNSSTLKDIAIINDTLAYAVGEIYLNDSTGRLDLTPYNLAIWNGFQWRLERAKVTYNGNVITLPLEGAFAFSGTDIWLVGSLPIHGDGKSWNVYDIRATTDSGLSVSRAWGTDSRNMYFVGRGGSIAHFDGTNWTKIQSGTKLDFYDIFGNGAEIVAVAGELLVSYDRKIVSVSSGEALIVPDSGVYETQHSIWSPNPNVYFVAGNGLYSKDNIQSKSPWQRLDTWQPSYYIFAIRGNGANDLFACGSYGEILHYNGSTWKSYRNNVALGNGDYNALAVRGNTVICVGEDMSGNAVIAQGNRAP